MNTAFSASVRLIALVLPLAFGVNAALASSAVPERLAGLALSGRSLDLVADRIDPGQPLGTCTADANGHELRITLPNVRNSEGNVRISLYSGVKEEWMAKGTKLIRFDVPAQEGIMHICLPLPYAPASFGVGLYHDEDADTDYDLSEGYGFSNNAKAGFLSPAPFRKAVFDVEEGRTDMEIRIRY